MPPVFHLDDYDDCMINPQGLYCFVDINLVSDSPNEVLVMIQRYSAQTKKHFNHSQLHHGKCVTQKCKKYIQDLNETDLISNHHLTTALEGCFNESLWQDYRLKTRVSHVFCVDNKKEVVFDAGDIALGVFIFIVLALNVIGSLYDVVLIKGNKNQVNKFQIKYNLYFTRLKIILIAVFLSKTQCLIILLPIFRTITMMCVIYCHSLMMFAFEPENPHHIEQLYDNILHYIFLNGFLVVQTFFIISGCLISYKLELYAEKHKVKWNLIPLAILMTWIKLTPSYMIILAISTTWLRHAGTGPFWEISVAKEVEDCRQNGWTNLLYINNYMVNSQCLGQSWYLGAAMQLSIVGYIVCVLPNTVKVRNIALTILFVIGVITPAVHTYYQDLDAVLMITPETARVFEGNPTFNYVYRMGHTNITNFIVGIVLGYSIYRWQKTGETFQRYKKHRYLLLLTFPSIIGMMFIGSVFYLDHLNAPVLVKAIYAGIVKPIYGIIMSVLIIAAVFKLENVYRAIFESSIWRIPAKLTYCAYIIHVTIIRAVVGNRTTLATFSNINMIEFSLACISLTFILSVPFWLLINTPLTQLLKSCVSCLLQMKEAHGTEKDSRTDKNSIILEVKNEIQKEVAENVAS
ncbi:hypothetical protein KGM_211433 [Danaus plexippus plexippus]|uniref:Acyltransferase 3 domain-containing protein n=1 Tax=Danaus plexippus plexippus TaxID=278856 RepID=A0A212EGP9_DANPL|nr:hypothetical protein KGM_211433 [Danaus plexippus plexippus]